VWCLIVDVDATCSDFNFGTALHIAAHNLCAGAVKTLLELGANPAFRVRDWSWGRKPHALPGGGLNSEAVPDWALTGASAIRFCFTYEQDDDVFYFQYI
jgi:hypothetical protein